MKIQSLRIITFSEETNCYNIQNTVNVTSIFKIVQLEVVKRCFSYHTPSKGYQNELEKVLINVKFQWSLLKSTKTESVGQHSNTKASCARIASRGLRNACLDWKNVLIHTQYAIFALHFLKDFEEPLTEKRNNKILSVRNNNATQRCARNTDCRQTLRKKQQRNATVCEKHRLQTNTFFSIYRVTIIELP